MVFTLDGNSEIVAHVWRNLCYLISLRHLIRSRAVIFFSSIDKERNMQFSLPLENLQCRRSQSCFRKRFFFPLNPNNKIIELVLKITDLLHL